MRSVLKNSNSSQAWRSRLNLKGRDQESARFASLPSSAVAQSIGSWQKRPGTDVRMYVCVCVHLPSRMVVGIAGCTGTEDRSTPLGSSQSCLPGYLPIDCDATDKTCPKTVTPRTIPTCRSKLPSLLAVAVWNWPGRLGRGVSKVARACVTDSYRRPRPLLCFRP